ncbi:MAG: type II toxin-antitoxin system VapC family toxin [Chloroflexi bacterium]|nr:type II toxin-antitoxin system VapC family toxin [Chloroflexota bacterium]
MPERPRAIVVDASVVLKWQLGDEEHIPQAIALRDDFSKRGVTKLLAPNLLVYEVINGIVTATKLKRIPLPKAVEAVSNLMALGIELKDVESRQVAELALRYNLTAYDAAYLALAEVQNCELWTGDRAFYQSTKNTTMSVRWLGDYVAEQR